MRLILILLYLLPLQHNCSNGLSFGSIGNVISAAKDMGAGLISSLGSSLPTPEELFETNKNLIAGYPFEFVSSSINEICSAALSADTINPKITPDINKMNFYLRTPCYNYSFPLLQANDVAKSREFNPNKKTVIFATGWGSMINESDIISAMAKAYHCRGDVNFIALDTSLYVNTLYSWSALNTEEIGENMATGLVQLSEMVPLENIHLIGHSLGAHIVGAAGRTFTYQTGKQIPRITGLDPAKPCFNEGETLSGLLRGDAEFVDIIHSNPGVLGKRDPMGDVDFYPGGLNPLPNGCISVWCAHGRSVEYYVESVYPGNENNFMAVRCTSLTRLKEKRCPGDAFPMGYNTSQSLKGNYFLDVRSSEPFGENGSIAKTDSNEKCGLCPSNK